MMHQIVEGRVFRFNYIVIVLDDNYAHQYPAPDDAEIKFKAGKTIGNGRFRCGIGWIPTCTVRELCAEIAWLYHAHFSFFPFCSPKGPLAASFRMVSI